MDVFTLCPPKSLPYISPGLNPLEVLKKGLTELSGTITNRKNKLTEKLSWGEAISPSDEQWLDNEGNTVYEERILEVLESAPDYGKAVLKLDNNGKAIVRKLQEWAGASAKVTRNKRKCMHPLHAMEMVQIAHICRPRPREVEEH